MSERAISSQEAPKPATAGRVRARRWPRVAGWFAAALGLVAVLIGWLYLGAPDLVRSEILKTIAQQYHRTARLERVRLDPLRLRAEFDGFDLPDRDGRSMLAFRKLTMKLSWGALLTGRLGFDELALDSPEVRAVRRKDGRLNLADLLPPQTSKSKPLSLRIAHLSLTGGRADLVDEMRAQPFEKRFDRISFTLRNFSTTTDGAAYSLSAESRAGERLSWRGVLGVSPLASKGRFELAGWRAERLAGLLQGALPFTLASGVLDVRGDYDLALHGEVLGLKVDLDQAVLTSPAIRPLGGAGGPLRAEALTVSGVRLDLARRAISIAHIVLSHPQVDAWRDRKGVLNLAAFVPPPAKGSNAEGPGWTVSAPDIRVERGESSFEDRAAPGRPAWTADLVDVAVGGFAYPLAGPLQVQVHAEVDDGSTLDLDGPLTLPGRPGAAPSGAFDVALVGVELDRFQPYIGRIAKVTVVGGDASARGRLELSPSGAVRFTGGLSVDSLQAVDPTLKSDLVTWDRVTATGVTAASNPFAVRIRRILATDAYGRVVLEPNYVFNIRAVLEQQDVPAGGASISLTSHPGPQTKPKAAPEATPARGAAIDLPIDIDRIDLVNGRMDFTDLTVQPHFATGVQDINGSITGLSARAGSRARVDLKGDAGPFAPVTISGALDPFGPDRFLDMAMGFHNMELTAFSPYSGKFAGYRIDKGKLDLDLRYHIENERLDAKHHVVIHQLQLGDKVDSTTATRLPVKLIVALLKDRNGVIDLPIDVTGSLDDPKFSMWPAIRQVVGNLFGKIATSPFTLLGRLAGRGGSEDIGRIVFQPGSAALAPGEAAKLSALAKALDQRPGLGLEIPATVAPALDGPVLEQAAYKNALQAAYREAFRRPGSPSFEQVQATPRLKVRLLETAYRDAYGQPPGPIEKAAQAGAKDRDAAAAGALEQALQAEAKAGAPALSALAEARSRAVETSLVEAGHVDPRRIFLVTAPPLAGGPITMAVALK